MAGPQPTWQRGDLLVRFVIPGEPEAKGNHREIAKFGDRVALRKGQKALDFEAIARQYTPKMPEPYEGDVAVHVRVFYKSRRPDLDASLVYDALQTRKVKTGKSFVLQSKVIVNDRQVRLKIEEGFVDDKRPRVEVAVYKAMQKLVGGVA